MSTLESDRDQPILNLLGERVGLGPLRRELVPLYLKWMNDFDVTRSMAIGWRPFTMEAQIRWWERVYSYNERGIRAYTRAGFQIAGRVREAFRRGGRAHDVILMDCLATEFQGSVLRQLLP